MSLVVRFEISFRGVAGSPREMAVSIGEIAGSMEGWQDSLGDGCIRWRVAGSLVGMSESPGGVARTFVGWQGLLGDVRIHRVMVGSLGR